MHAATRSTRPIHDTRPFIGLSYGALFSTRLRLPVAITIPSGRTNRAESTVDPLGYLRAPNESRAAVSTGQTTNCWSPAGAAPHSTAGAVPIRSLTTVPGGAASILI